MNYFNKKRLAIITIVVLLIINITTIGTVLYHTHIKPKRVYDKERTYRNTKKHMRFTREQRVLFRKKVMEFRKKTNPLHHQISEIRSHILDELAKQNPDTTLIFDLNEKAGELHLELKRQTILNLIELKQSWDPEQYDVLDKMFRQTMMDDYRGPGKYKMRRNQEGRKREQKER